MAFTVTFTVALVTVSAEAVYCLISRRTRGVRGVNKPQEYDELEPKGTESDLNSNMCCL